ncbi:MAG: relaxase/mobilization nuclease domain-containing protein [Pseudomonadota bacterium]
MILKGNRRGGATQLSAHLLNEEDNDHVTVHELRGFVSDDLRGALMEAYGVSRGTKCQRFLYSLSLSPPQTENVPVSVFEDAVDRIEKQLGFEGQPRAIVFHEKEGRRHAHCLWSRIDVQRMKAIDPSYDKLQLRDISRSIYMEQKWKMPRGLMNSEERDPLNFTMAEWQQAKRQGVDPRTIKTTIQECWAVSDSRDAFAAVLRERGYWLARGDKRGAVVVDWRGEVYAVARMAGVRTKEVKDRLGDCTDLPSVDETSAMLAELITEKHREFANVIEDRFDDERAFLTDKKKALVRRQRAARAKLIADQKTRRGEETKRLAAQLPRGLKALWFRLTGRYALIKNRIEGESEATLIRDQMERQRLIQGQLNERRRLQTEIASLQFRRELEMKRVDHAMNKPLHREDDKPTPHKKHHSQRRLTQKLQAR